MQSFKPRNTTIGTDHSQLENVLELPKSHIKGTIFTKCSPDHVADEGLFREACSAGVIIEKGGYYLVPVRIPTIERPGNLPLSLNVPNGRSVHTPHDEGRSYIFLGSGEPGHGETSFVQDERFLLATHVLRGGLVRKEYEDRLGNEKRLKELYRDSEGEPFLQEARKYGVSEDMFHTIIASFKVNELPLCYGGRLTFEDAKSQLKDVGVPEQKAKEQRIMLYTAYDGNRISEMGDITEDPDIWKPVFQHYGFDLNFANGKPTVGNQLQGEVPYEEAAKAVLLGAAARYAVWNRLIQGKTGGCSSEFRWLDTEEQTDEYFVGGTFQADDMNANVNPLVIFDYHRAFGLNPDSIEPHLLTLGKKKDHDGAKRILEITAEKLGIKEKIGEAKALYEKIFRMS